MPWVVGCEKTCKQSASVLPELPPLICAMDRPGSVERCTTQSVACISGISTAPTKPGGRVCALLTISDG